MPYSIPFIQQRPQHNCRIGFNDTVVMIAMIPALAFLIPVVFFGIRFHRPVEYTWAIYLHTFITTLVVWVGNRLVMIEARKRYPDFADVRRRLLVQSAIMFFFTFAATNVLAFLLKDLCDFSKLSGPGKSTGDILFNANSASLFCSLTIAALYESQYFMSELRRSVEETELLKRESLNAQLDALRTQINPHFLFNNLNTLTAIIPDEPETAVLFVQQLSRVYRHILEVKDEPSILLKEELGVLKSYSFLLQTRFGKNFNLRVDIDDTWLTQRVPPLSLQLLLENAIKHNVVSKDHPLFIHVFVREGKLVVSNNLQPKKQAAASVGIGLDNIRKRSSLLTGKLVEVVNGPENFIVSIPLIQN